MLYVQYQAAGGMGRGAWLSKERGGQDKHMPQVDAFMKE